jgi:plasmid stabilization system protein ParE
MRLRLSLDAAQDVEEIWEYIATDNVGAADRFAAKLSSNMRQLAKAPGMGHSRADLTELPVLFWPVDSYLIIYRTTGAVLEVVAVVRGSRDIPTFLRRRFGERPG